MLQIRKKIDNESKCYMEWSITNFDGQYIYIYYQFHMLLAYSYNSDLRIMAVMVRCNLWDCTRVELKGPWGHHLYFDSQFSATEI